MKATKKIVGAACALVAAVALSAGSTFAWFATNSTVSASDMQISVVTSSTYLLIGNTDSLTDIQAQQNPNISFADTSVKSLTPVAHETFSSKADVTSTTNMWYTMVGTSFDNGTGTGDKHYISSLNGYVTSQSVYLTTKANSGAVGAITASVAVENANAMTGTSETVKPVCVILVCGDTYLEYTSTNGTSWSATSTTIAENGVVDDSATTEVAVYVYYNGSDSEVTTQNAAANNLENAKITVTFRAADYSA
ncbi:MAG: hypothetical protein ACI4MN_01570 [Candidatus Coproplasma sp.]